MSNKMIKDVAAFHKKFGLPCGDGQSDLISIMEDHNLQQFRIKFIQEELDELKLAFSENNKVGVFDALLDICYVALGTALFAGITPDMWSRGWRSVQKCNIAKVRAKSSNESKRNSTFDVVKPEGWTGPEANLKRILDGEEI